MARASFVAILALVITGAASVACTNDPGDFGGGRGSIGAGSRQPRERNTGSGDIGGDPATPNEETLEGADPGSDPDDDVADEDQTDPEPPADPSPGAGTPPPPPDPVPEPIPPGSFAVGTELVTTANLNIREGADTTYAILTTAPNGSRVTVVTVSGASGWVNIMWNGNVGWSSKAYLALP